MEAASALEPGLTARDRRVLAAVPSGAGEPACGITAIIAKVPRPDAQTITREEIIATVRGLEHLGYVAYSRGVYWRTARGAAALDD